MKAYHVANSPGGLCCGCLSFSESGARLSSLWTLSVLIAPEILHFSLISFLKWVLRMSLFRDIIIAWSEPCYNNVPKQRHP